MTEGQRKARAVGALAGIEAALLFWVRLVQSWPRVFLLLVTALAVAGSLLAMKQLRVNTDASDMIDPELPYRVAQRDFEAAFPELDDVILVWVRAPSADEVDAFTARLSGALSSQTETIRSVYAPTAHPFFARNGLLLLSETKLESQLNRLTKASPVIEALNSDQSADTLFATLARRADLAASTDTDDGSFLDPVYRELAAVIDARLSGSPRPLSWQRLFTVDDSGTSVHQRVIAISPELDFSSLQPAREVLRVIRDMAAQIENEADWGGLEYGVTGTPALRTEELRSVSSGIEISLGLSFVLVAILLWLAFRSFGMVLTALATLVLTLGLTAGLATLTVGALNLVSIAFAVLLIGLGIDFAIHFALHIMETRRSGTPNGEAVQLSIREVGGALALCAPTTALAFFAFVPTQFVGMAQLGIISGAGVLIAFIVAVTVIPAAAAILPVGRGRRAPASGQTFSSVTRGRLGRGLALTTIILGVAALPLLTQVRFDADPMRLRDPDSPSVKTFQKLFDDPNTTPYRLDVLTGSQEERAALKDRLEALPQVGKVISLDNFVPADQEFKLELIDLASTPLQSALRGPSSDATPSAPASDRQNLPGLETLRAQLAQGSATPAARQLDASLEALARASSRNTGLIPALEGDLFRFWDFQMNRLKAQLAPEPVALEDLPPEIVERYRARDGRIRLEIVPDEALDMRDEAMRKDFVDAVVAIAPEATGSALTVLKAADIVAQAMVQASVTAALVVFVLLWLLLRDVVMVLVILFPVVLAAIFTSAAGVLLGQPYNFANVIVIPLLIGLGADSGIHLALRSRQFVRHSSVFTTTTPRAVFFSALTTIASFGTLVLSDHRGTASMGALLTLAISFTLLCSLLVLPATLDTLNRRRSA